MKSIKHSFTRWLPLVLLTALLLSACQSGETGSSGPAGQGNLADNGSGFSPAAGTFNLPDPALGLDQLDAYTALLTVTFDGQRDGSPHAWERTYRMAVDAGASPARQVEVLVQSGSGAPEPRLLAAEGGTPQAVVEAAAECAPSRSRD